jgi:hypothetical protein
MRTFRFRLVPLALTGAALFLTLVASAGARRAPSRQSRTALIAAVHTSSVGGLNKIPSSHYRVTDAQISSVSSSWASAQLTPTAAYRSTFQSVTIVAVQPAGTSRWVVVDLGSAQVGCGIAPDKVLQDLYRAKRPCASGGIS